ncbi:hypothetical protein KSS87_020543, partial [Heliosperma pusillum]
MDYKMIMVALASIIMVSLTTTQAQVPACLEALLPCQPFMASPTPPEACCGPLKKVFETELACLCAAFSNPDLAAAFDMNKAMQLPVKCGVENAGPNMCINGGLPTPSIPSSPGAPAPPTASSSPPPTSFTPPGAPPPPPPPPPPPSAFTPPGAPPAVPTPPATTPSSSPPTIPPPGAITPSSAPPMMPPPSAMTPSSAPPMMPPPSAMTPSSTPPTLS